MAVNIVSITRFLCHTHMTVQHFSLSSIQPPLIQTKHHYTQPTRIFL